MNATAARAAATADMGRRNTNSRSAVVPSGARSLSPGGQQAPGAARRCACGGIVGAGGECAACRQKRLTKLRMVRSGPASHSSIAGPSVHSVLASPGRPLEVNARLAAERAFGVNLGSTRIHSGPEAAASAASVGAAGYAIGRHVVFGSGRYEPHTTRGRALLMHELAHVAQQRGAELPSVIEIGRPSDREEHEASAAARRAVSGASIGLSPSQPRLRRELADAPSSGFCQPEAEEGIRRSPIKLDDGTVVCRTITQRPCDSKPKTRTFWRGPTADDPSFEYQVCRGDNVLNVTGQARLAPSSDARPSISFGGDIDFTHILGPKAAIGGYIAPDLKFALEGVTQSVSGGVVAWGGGYVGKVSLLNALSPERKAAFELSFPFGQTGTGLTASGSVGKVGEQTAWTVGFAFGTIQAPPTPTPCFQCVCPPADFAYSCERPKSPPKPEPVTKHFRYYYHWDTALKDSEDLTLAKQSHDNVEKAIALYSSPGQWRIDSITGFASPEGTERHNQPLSKARADELVKKLLANRAMASAVLPPAVGAGELLGRRAGKGPIPTDATCDAEKLTSTLQPALRVCRPGGDQRLDLCDAELRSRFKVLLGGPDRACAIQLLGGPDASSDVNAAVDAFIQRFQKGQLGAGVTAARPWDEIFRPLRYAEVVISGTPAAQPAPPGTVRVPGRECDKLAADNAALFGARIQLPPLKGCDPHATPGG
jgi:hypothetical protein